MHFKVFLIYIVFILTVSVSAMELCYKKSWVDYNFVNKNNTAFSFHEKVAETVAKAHHFCASEFSNIAAIAFCLHDYNNEIIAETTFQCLFSSGMYKNNNGGVSVMPVKEMFLTSFNSALENEIKFVQFIAETIDEEFESIIKLLNDKKSQQYIVPDLTLIKENSESDKKLGSILHSEQAFFIQKILDDTFLKQFITKANNDAKIKNKEIKYSSLNIVTYTDMCPNCFKTYYSMQQKLKEDINTILNVTTPFHIFISSFRPYSINKNEETRQSLFVKKTKDYKTFQDHNPKNYKIVNNFTSEDMIIQFFNPWIIRHVVSLDLIDCINNVLSTKSLFLSLDVKISEYCDKIKTLVEFLKTKELVLNTEGQQAIEAYKNKMIQYQSFLARTFG